MESLPAAAPARDWGANLSLKVFRYRMLVKRRWWVPALTVGIGLACGAWISFQKPVEYISRGELSVSETIDVSGAVTIRRDDNEENFYGTTLMMIQNDDVQELARRKVAVDSPKLAGKINDLTATRSPGTSIFTVAAIGSNPDYTQAYVNAVMEEFINYKQIKRQGVTNRAAGQIGDQLSKQREELDQREKELRDYAEQNDMTAWGEQNKRAALFLSDLTKKRDRMETELDRMEHLSPEQLLNLPATGDEKSTSDSKDGGAPGSPIGAELAAQYLKKALELSSARASLAEWSKVWKPKHPKLIAIQDEVSTLQGEIEDIKAQNAEQTKVEIGTIKADLASLDENIKSWEEKAKSASLKNDAYQQRVDARTRAQDLYTKLLSDLNSVNTTIGKDETIQTLEDASPAEKVSRGTVEHVIVGLIIGFLSSIVVLYLLDRADDRLTSSTELMDRFSEPIVGQIPNVGATRTEAGLPLLHSDDDRYTFAESFRSLRSSLIFMPNQGELRTLIVTSAIPGEGKSTVASNLAITMSLAGARVLLVDADLRRGDLTELFKLESRVGLSSVLRGEVTMKAALQKTKYPTLTLMPSGPVTNQSAELLLKPSFALLLAECRNDFDLTIFNTSPILATDDTATIAPNFDGTLMVVRAQFTSARLVTTSLKALYQRQVNVLGLILNCVDTEMPDYYYYRYPKYYAA